MIKMQPITKDVFRNNKIVLLLWAILFLISLISVIASNHGYLNIFFSQNYNSSLGVFFKYLTKLGEETLLIPIALVVLFVVSTWEFVLRIGGTMLINSLITTILKFTIFSTERPKLTLQKFNLVFTEGIDVHQYNSFPSGHTSAAFALAFSLAFWFNGKPIGLLVIIIACGVGLSRIYLQQHFLEDVLGGSLIGLISAILAGIFKLTPKNK